MHAFLIWALDGVSDEVHALAPLNVGKYPSVPIG
jgi:hypothetical protein